MEGEENRFLSNARIFLNYSGVFSSYPFNLPFQRVLRVQHFYGYYHYVLMVIIFLLLLEKLFIVFPYSVTLSNTEALL